MQIRKKASVRPPQESFSLELPALDPPKYECLPVVIFDPMPRPKLKCIACGALQDESEWTSDCYKYAAWVTSL